ncbi:MAG: substrate-binding domain-containing protein [Polaromonas sp.]|uniref:substrate-binding domain-containing protein n=1 Tax=Polaromonas sp. TaxID=1869339 RepID=UPI00248A7F2D|nr:substrate-binding domain-containing protein [Polaromonas sp.]MDI1271758.1 substrate-binding domain-containing protein [Polaromonas sp.]
MKKKLTLSAIPLALAMLAGGALADTVKISGAGTVFADFVSSGKAAVEKSTGHTLQIVSSNSGKGLADLASGAADIAMVSEPMDVAGPLAEVAGTKIDPKTVQFFVLKKAELVFIVHPNNPVGKLTPEQLRDILTGKIANWKEVGGKDKAIVVYGEGPTAGTRALIKKLVMGGAEYGPGLKAQTSIKRAAELVATDEAAIAGVGRNFVEAGKTKAIDSKKFERPLALATVGAPKPAAKAVIDAYAKEAK